MALIAIVAVQGQSIAAVDHSSLLYTLVSGEEVVEGPLDPTAYAQTGGSVAGTRMAAVDGGLGIDITFSDPEVQFSATLGGNVAQAPLSVLEPKPTDDSDSSVQQNPAEEAQIYTVQDGDTIAGIAEQFGVSVDTVLSANSLRENDTLKVGDNLTILSTSGVLHTVSSGDTLLAIANRYDVDALEIKEYNNMEDSHTLAIGQKLVVPGGKAPAPAAAPSIAPRNTRVASNDGPTPQPASVAGVVGMVWPTVSHHISQYFRWGHTGLDISNRSRPALYASAAGTVEYAGWLGAYGNLIILNHGNGLQTYYAHNQTHYVSVGQQVAKGQAIAQMGSTGRSTGPHVHWEVRKNGVPQNPCAYTEVC